MLAISAWATPLAARADTGIVPLSPHPQEHVATTTPSIVAALPAINGRTPDRSTVRLLLDGQDRSDAVSVADGRVRYDPSTPLASGQHAVEVDVTDASGGRLSYQWTFTIDGPAPNDAAPYGQPNAPSYAAPADGMLGGSLPFGTGFGSFYSLSPAPFYWGDSVRFVFVGTPRGFGFLTFGGIPGFFNLIPFGFNTYYVIVPIPVGFVVSNPFIACHFFPAAGTPVVVPYRHHIAIVWRRNSATLTVAHASLAMHASPAMHATKPPTRNSGAPGRVAAPRLLPLEPRPAPVPVPLRPAPHMLSPSPVSHVGFHLR